MLLLLTAVALVLVLAVLLYGCESWCLTGESVRRLSN